MQAAWQPVGGTELELTFFKKKPQISCLGELDVRHASAQGNLPQKVSSACFSNWYCEFCPLVQTWHLPFETKAVFLKFFRSPWSQGIAQFPGA